MLSGAFYRHFILGSSHIAGRSSLDALGIEYLTILTFLGVGIWFGLVFGRLLLRLDLDIEFFYLGLFWT